MKKHSPQGTNMVTANTTNKPLQLVVLTSSTNQNVLH